MPSTSPAQARLMAAVAHGWHKPGGGGPPVSVAKEFNQADKGHHAFAQGGPVNKSYMSKNQSFAQGGEVLGKESEWLKSSDRFTGHKNRTDDNATEDKFEKGA